MLTAFYETFACPFVGNLLLWLVPLRFIDVMGDVDDYLANMKKKKTS